MIYNDDEWSIDAKTLQNRMNDNKRITLGEGYIHPDEYEFFDDIHFSWLKLKELGDKDMRDEANEYLDVIEEHPVVGNINLKKLSSLPYHERKWEKIGHPIYHYRSPLKLEIAHRIFKGYVNRPISELRKRVHPYIKNIKTFKSWIHWYIEDNIEPFHKEYGGYYFIDQDDILRYIPRIKKLPWRNKKKLTKQEHYKLVSEGKKRRKCFRDEKKTRGLVEVSMINNSLLFDFYHSLKSEISKIEGYYNRYLSNKKDYEEKVIPKGKYNFSRWSMTEALRKWRLESPKLPELRAQLKSLEAGDKNIFLTSQTYLYSIGKECHHF